MKLLRSLSVLLVIAASSSYAMAEGGGESGYGDVEAGDGGQVGSRNAADIRTNVKTCTDRWFLSTNINSSHQNI